MEPLFSGLESLSHAAAARTDAVDSDLLTRKLMDYKKLNEDSDSEIGIQN